MHRGAIFPVGGKKNLKLRRDRIIVVLLQKICVYNFTDSKLIHQIETVLNPKGLCEVSNTSSPMVLVCPGLQKGQIRVENYGSKRTRFVMAYDSSMACMTMTQDGRSLATASSNGTLIRVFNTLDGSLLQELRVVCGSVSIPEGVKYFVAFGHQKNTVLIIGMDGSLYRCEFDPEIGGEMAQLEYHNFLNVDNFLQPGETFPKSMQR